MRVAVAAQVPWVFLWWVYGYTMGLWAQPWTFVTWYRMSRSSGDAMGRHRQGTWKLEDGHCFESLAFEVAQQQVGIPARAIILIAS